jgi:hypothetical protein
VCRKSGPVPGNGLCQPIDTLKPVAPDIWILDGPVIRMATPFGGMPFPTRMTVVRLHDGGMWCHSPIAPDENLFRAIDALGPVRQLVSPNLCCTAPPSPHGNTVIRRLSRGRRRACAAAQHVEVAFDADLADSPPRAWAGDLDRLCFRGSRVIGEFVFFHHASATLVLADLIENFERDRLTRGMRLLAWLGGVLDPDGKAPLDMRMTSTGHEWLSREGIGRIMAWHPRRVILAHGRWYPGNGEAGLRRAFRWVR